MAGPAGFPGLLCSELVQPPEARLQSLSELESEPCQCLQLEVSSAAAAARNPLEEAAYGALKRI
eukprot:3252304-Rhodomonas_salina.1